MSQVGAGSFFHIIKIQVKLSRTTKPYRRARWCATLPLSSPLRSSRLSQINHQWQQHFFIPMAFLPPLLLINILILSRSLLASYFSQVPCHRLSCKSISFSSPLLFWFFSYQVGIALSRVSCLLLGTWLLCTCCMRYVCSTNKYTHR